MKSFTRSVAILLLLMQLFSIPAFADGEVSADVIEKMKAAGSGPAVSSGVVTTKKEASAAEESSADVSDVKPDSKKASGAVAYEIAPVTAPGTCEDVMIGGLAIRAGVWYTVDSEGTLTSSEPWPDSYLFYSASQSKLTLHEFHYRVSGDTKGKDNTFAALYLPKDMHIVLEGDNELINSSYTTAGGGMSNGVYAPDHTITFEGNGALQVNTLADASLKGYGIGAGSIRIDGDFVGLAAFGMTSAFSCAPTVPESRKMLANVADLHPGYHGDVRVREASPYDRSIFTRFRYVLIAVGKKISQQEEMREKIEAEYYRTKMEYNVAVDEGYAEAVDGFMTEVAIGLYDFSVAMDQEMNDITNFSWDADSAASQLGMMLMSGGA